LLGVRNLQGVTRSRESLGRYTRLRRTLLAALVAIGATAAITGCGDNDAGNGAKGAQTNPASGKAAKAVAAKPVAVKETPTTPFDPNQKAGLKPPVPRRIGQSLPAPGELFTTLDKYVGEVAKSRGIDYISAQANGDSPKQFQQTQDFLSRGVGGLIVTDLAPPALVPLQLKAIQQGAAVFTAPFAYSTTQGTTDQYKVGHAQGESAVRWIKEQLGGNGEVAMFNQATSAPIKPRDKGVRDALEEGGPGIKLVSDVTLKQVSADEGVKLTTTIRQKHPNVNAWIGPDSVLTGTLAALEAARKAGDSSGLFGTDGDAQALSEIEKGGPYKSTQAFLYSLLSYAWGQYASDWFDGKSIPMVMRFNPIELNSKPTIDAFNKIKDAPALAFAENQRNSKYYQTLGNTSYEHNRYLSVVAE
jgi:ribose transport system substrate-binding protein